jgi:hypothetical protein
MTIDTEQYAQFFQQGQDAVRTTVETWTNTVKAAAGQFPVLASTFDAEAAIDQYYDLNEKVLEAQRDFVKRLVASGAAVAATVKA